MDRTIIDDLLDATYARIAAQRRLPESTYRLQFHAGFTFRDAAAVVPYLRDLGVTHVYASPYLKARPGSTHGYDVIDHNQLNPELGTRGDYEAFCAALRDNGMSHVLDTVPNHVGVATNDNAWWNDVLEDGPSSPYAAYFDIAWRGSPRKEMHNLVLLPVLGGLYGDVLEKGELKLVREDGKVWVRYYDRRFPIDRVTLDPNVPVERYNGTPGDPRSFDRLDALLDRQHYRLACWRTAPDEINYRRFFDVNDLAALAMERLDVFEAAHDLTLRLCAAGDVTGLRIDHPDGLYDPKQYLDRLQQHYVLAVAKSIVDDDPKYAGVDWHAFADRLSSIDNRQSAIDNPLYVVVEKILALGEPLPDDWATHGTSGYDFLILANGLFVDPANEAAFTKLYQDFVGDRTAFEDLVYEKKKLILRISLASELHMLAHRVDRLASRDRRWRDFTLLGITDALREVIACFPVYRSYITESGVVGDTDRRRIEQAVDEATRRNPKTDRSVFDFLRDLLLQRSPATFTDADRAEQRRIAGKFQQVTAPVTAKGIEDTAFYLYNRLASLNEVGGEPSHFGLPPETLHAYLADRQQKWPYALSGMSTHDTKRSEDVRARLNALSEMPEAWDRCVRRWRELNAPHRRSLDRGLVAPHANDEYLIYQTLLGAWPLEPYAEGEYAAFVERVQAYMQKAMREAKAYTSWTSPNEAYETGVKDFVAAILDPAQAKAFHDDLAPFRRKVSRLGFVNSLAQTVLKLTAPGVPDTYQGTELWDFSLVDPDNRRPVDYDKRRSLQAELPAGGEVASLLAAPEDGRVKLFVTRALLDLRRRHPGLFSTGDYVPLTAEGADAHRVFAFARRAGDRSAVVVIPRLAGALVAEQGPLAFRAGAWGEARLALPQELRGAPFRNVFTHRPVSSPGGIKDLLSDFPVAVLVTGD